MSPGAKRKLRWIGGLLFSVWILVPASIGAGHAFGAWWGGLIVPLTLASVLGVWWAIDHIRL
jgi:hypothetical protein